MNRMKKGILSASLSLLATLTMFSSTSVLANTGKLELENCHVDGIKQLIKCGKLEVPENYQKPDGSKITLNVAVLPAIDNSTYYPPMMFLAGGPGQGAASLAAVIKRGFKETNKTRDIIMVDQRGTGESATLECPSLEIPDPYASLPEDIPLADVEKCIAELKGDLSQFNSENAIRDFDAVRAALGHKTMNLYGGSYGTRAALVYMRMFPQNLESVVLDSVGPVEVPIGLFGQSGARSFRFMLENCKNDQYCNAAYPNLRQEFDQVMVRLAEAPVNLEIPHPRLGTKTTLKVSDAKFISYIRMMLYSPSTHAMIPLLINQTYQQNFAPLAGYIAATSEGMGVNEAVLFNIVCNEDYPRVSEQDLAADAANDLDGEISQLAFKLVCPMWPKYQVSEDFYQPVVNDIPTLILSGKLDPVTPPSNGDYSDKTLKNSVHIIDEHAAHIVNQSQCSSKIIADFFKDPQPSQVDASCLKEQPAQTFVTGLNGGNAQ